MSFAPMPATAAWRHRGARSGFEVVYFSARGDGCRIEGWTTAIEDGATWAVEYLIEADAALRTRRGQSPRTTPHGICAAPHTPPRPAPGSIRRGILLDPAGGRRRRPLAR